MSGLMLAMSRPEPQTPPLQEAIADNYERFDGLDSTPYPLGDVEPTGLNPDVRPGQRETHGSFMGPNARGIPGVVGSVGASPLPVADCLHKTEFATQAATQSNPNFRFGPGGAAPGLSQTIAMSEISKNPPQPGDLAAIFAGLA